MLIRDSPFAFVGRKLVLCISLFFLLCTCACFAQSGDSDQSENAPKPEATTGRSQQDQPASITGKAADQSGVSIKGVLVTFTRNGESSGAQVASDAEGRFSFVSVAPGPFHLAIAYPGFAPVEFVGNLQPGEAFVTPLITLKVATVVTEVHVGLPPEELADVQIRDQLKQRVFGIVPNFYVSYVSNPAALRPKHKFELAWRSTVDPVTLLGVAAVAGFSQAGDRWGDYGQGAQGYGKRFGAEYGNVLAGTYLGSAVLPSLFKQDPRYFYKGTGSKRSRLFHALAFSVICRGDNRRTQVNYSSILGNFAAGGISNLYYPARDRNGLGGVFSTAMVRIGETALASIFQEFIVSKSLAQVVESLPTAPRTETEH